MSHVLHHTCLKSLNFRNVGKMKSHIQALPYQIVQLPTQLVYFGNSVHIVIPYSLSRENAIFATLITPLEKSNDLRNLISLEEFSCGTSSGRSFLRYFFLFFGCDPWSLISFFEILSKTFAKQTIYFKKISYRLLCVSFFILTLQGLGRRVVE